MIHWLLYIQQYKFHAIPFYLLSFRAKIMAKAFVKMVLTEEDEMIVSLCLIIIALAVPNLP